MEVREDFREEKRNVSDGDKSCSENSSDCGLSLKIKNRKKRNEHRRKRIKKRENNVFIKRRRNMRRKKSENESK